ncbi:hypothetical protein J6350_11375 [Burkholderia pseudomallei]|uniref:hypothetical protein n=1 Tax=Burkholderia pseudomallei TaxID=28450 RepID=UPI001AAF465C|nr:hypothetical protein [Burkholderia pseudomallei]MBO2953942.1 hypothetical protein [Burkholderia pseudomallei]MBO3033504.1 hypothetical protein [Burkholderia pseudomallei]MBO3050727.1 hypothetical protein [Burkholderia pseudomallei]MBO7845726.1 hypothetical protein [Burkholderia pseudomallei]
MSTRRSAFVLAVGATATALCLSVLAGWQRGGTLPERLIWIAIGMVLVTSAHLLPALIREMPIAIRGVGSVLWGACLLAACFGHAVFFTLAQQHAGELRAATVRMTSVPESARSLTAVMAERATVTAQLAVAQARNCIGNCTTLRSRRVTLAARLDALNAEAEDVRRQQAAVDRVTVQHDALLVDPVTSRLAALLGITAMRVDLLSGLMFAAVLEGVACLLWTVALRSPGTEAESSATGVTSPAVATVTMTGDVTAPVVAAVTDATDLGEPGVTQVIASHASETVSRKEVTARHETTPRSHAPRDGPIMPFPTARADDHLSQLVRDVTAGLVRPTVADIRRHLGCSQARAAELRRRLAEHTSTA